MNERDEMVGLAERISLGLRGMSVKAAPEETVHVDRLIKSGSTGRYVDATIHYDVDEFAERLAIAILDVEDHVAEEEATERRLYGGG